MTRSALRRTVAAFLFLHLSLTALAAAAPARPAKGPSAGLVKSQSSFSLLWNQVIRLWEKAGGSLDSDGKPQANLQPNSGSSLDPNGFTPDNGSSLDPDGAK